MSDKKTKKKAIEYNSSHIESLGGLEGLRKNPSMYLGSVDASGVFLSVRELLDNALDEHLAGRNQAVRLHLDKDGSYWVLDHGTGIPQGIKKLEVHINGKDMVNNVPTMQAVFGELHTSGKYRTEAYKVSVGTHGVGSKGTNATADYFDVSTFFKGKWYSVGFKKGKLTSPVQQMKSAPKGPDGKALTKGTCIHFKPDQTIFTAKSFPPIMAVEWAEIMAYLNPGFAIVISSDKGKKTFLSKLGPVEYVNKRIEKLKATKLSEKMFSYSSELADIVISFTNCEGSDIRGFTNGLSNPEGGTHLQSTIAALFLGLTKALTKMGKEKLVTTKVKGETKAAFTSSEFRDGLLGLVNAKLHKAQFSSQNKAKLTDARMGKDFQTLLVDEAATFFGKNKDLAVQLAERATKLANLKFNFAKDRKLISSLKALKSKGMPIKYTPPNRATKIADREVFLVEGDSAGGTAKTARLSNQGILPLRGKIINAIKDSKKKPALASEEVIHILGAIGFDPKSEDKYEKLQVGKIIFLADPDPDGYHINTLLLALFYKYLPELFEKGMIYIAYSPEFYSIYKGVVYTGSGSQKLRSKLNKAGAPSSQQLHHIKGWGEISPNLLRMLALDPATRTLIQINPLSAADNDFQLLMADDVLFRKKLLGLQ